VATGSASVQPGAARVAARVSMVSAPMCARTNAGEGGANHDGSAITVDHGRGALLEALQGQGKAGCLLRRRVVQQPVPLAALSSNLPPAAQGVASCRQMGGPWKALGLGRDTLLVCKQVGPPVRPSGAVGGQ
jgi:hypothetical protein